MTQLQHVNRVTTKPAARTTADGTAYRNRNTKRAAVNRRRYLVEDLTDAKMATLIEQVMFRR